MASCLIAVFAVIAVAAALRWRRPDPKHEFMLDLYAEALGVQDSEEPDQSPVPQNSRRIA